MKSIITRLQNSEKYVSKYVSSAEMDRLEVLIPVFLPHVILLFSLTTCSVISCLHRYIYSIKLLTVFPLFFLIHIFEAVNKSVIFS